MAVSTDPRMRNVKFHIFFMTVDLHSWYDLEQLCNEVENRVGFFVIADLMLSAFATIILFHHTLTINNANFLINYIKVIAPARARQFY